MNREAPEIGRRAIIEGIGNVGEGQAIGAIGHVDVQVCSQRDLAGARARERQEPERTGEREIGQREIEAGNHAGVGNEEPAVKIFTVQGRARDKAFGRGAQIRIQAADRQGIEQ